MAASTGQPPSLPYEPVGRWGHISAVIQDRQYTINGRYGALASRPPPTMVEILDIHVIPNWQQKATSGQPPPGTLFAACIAMDSYIYHFGGYGGATYYNTIHRLDTKRQIWKEISTSNPGEAPIAKCSAGMIALSPNILVIAAGYGKLPDHHSRDAQYTPNPDPEYEGRGWTNELHCFHVDSRTWSSPKTSGSAPPPCRGHSFTRVDLYRAVLFGGSQLDKLLPSHVYILDMRSWGWSRVVANGGPGQPWPVSRDYHSAVSLYDSDTNPSNPTLIVMWGVGGDGEILNDWWLFGVNAQHWRKVMLPDTLRGRMWHTTTIVDCDPTHKKLIHFGGLDEEPEDSDEDDDPDTWHPLAETTIVELDCSGTPGECVVTDIILSDQLGQPRENKDALPRHIQLTLEEEMRHLTVCDRVIQEKGKLLLNILQCIISGHPRVGKSTLLGRLTGQQPSVTPDLRDTSIESQTVQVRDSTPITSSTGVAENIIQVTVKKMKMVVAKSLQPGLVWEVITYDVEAIGLLKAVTKAHIGGKVLLELPASENTIKHDNSESAKTSSASASLSSKSDSQSDNTAHSGLQPFFRFRKPGGVSSSAAIIPGFKPPLEIFKEALKNERWGAVEAFLTDSLTIYFTDTGGQPEFQDVLPALIAGPSLFFLVFKLTDDLDQKYRVKFVRSPTQETMPYESSFTVKEALLQSLASIASTCTYASYKSTKTVAIEPKVVLVGTHEDLASEGQIKAIQQEMKDTLKQTEYYRKNVIEFASEDEPVVTVNNISSDGMDAQKIRRIVERIARHPSFHIEVPLPWLVLSLALRCLQVPIISYEQCLSIASECGIDSRGELDEALWFLHTKVGVLRYFKNVKELSDVVILDPQLIYGNITELISSTFVFKQAGPYAAQQFKEIGMFSLSTIEELTRTSTVSADHLSSVKLVKLLEHLHIIAPIRDAGGDVARYFMPCVLGHAAISASTTGEECYGIPPLLVTFRCGYCPKGVFSALTVNLISNHNIEEAWHIKEDTVSRNRITFEVGREFHAISITSHATHLEISVHATTRASADKLQTSPHEVCSSIRHRIEQGIVAVSRCLHYNCDSSFNFGFYCTCQSCSHERDHPAVCRHQDPCVVKCMQSGETYDIPDINRIWFGHPHLRSCQVPRIPAVLQPVTQERAQVGETTPVTLNNVTHHSLEHLHGIESFAETSFVITGSHSQTFEWEGYGLELHIPEGAVPADHTECRIDIKAGLSGQFSFPDDSQLVSCVYWIACSQKFLKSVTLDIEHCAAVQDSSQSSSLRFVAAKCSQTDLPYQFRELKKATFSPQSSFGSVQVSQFSFFAIIAYNVCWWSRRYLAIFQYTKETINQWRLYFFITWNLPGCRKAVEAELQAIGTKFAYQLLKDGGFEFEVKFQDPQNSISLDIGKVVNNGWRITPFSHPEITKEQVDRTFPHCCLSIQWTRVEEPVELEHKVKLIGAKGSNVFICIKRSPEAVLQPVTLERAQVGETTPATWNIVTHHSSEAAPQNTSQTLQYLTSSQTGHAQIPDHSHMDVDPTAASPTEPFCEAKPTMPELLIFTCADNAKVRIVKEIGTKYEDFGILLLQDKTGASVKNIAHRCSIDPEGINREILRQWLAGMGKQPVTWATLVEVLHDIGLSTLADGISTVQCLPSNRK